jgi:hypothetical protein
MSRSLLQVSRQVFILMPVMFLCTAIFAQKKQEVRTQPSSTGAVSGAMHAEQVTPAKSTTKKKKRKTVTRITHHSDNDSALEAIKKQKNKQKEGK